MIYHFNDKMSSFFASGQKRQQVKTHLYYCPLITKDRRPAHPYGHYKRLSFGMFVFNTCLYFYLYFYKPVCAQLRAWH